MFPDKNQPHSPPLPLGTPLQLYAILSTAIQKNSIIHRKLIKIKA